MRCELRAILRSGAMRGMSNGMGFEHRTEKMEKVIGNKTVTQRKRMNVAYWAVHLRSKSRLCEQPSEMLPGSNPVRLQDLREDVLLMVC